MGIPLLEFPFFHAFFAIPFRISKIYYFRAKIIAEHTLGGIRCLKP